jgi:hypothetical protein
MYEACEQKEHHLRRSQFDHTPVRSDHLKWLALYVHDKKLSLDKD